MAREAESLFGDIGAIGDTRQDTPLKAFTAANSLDPGGQRHDDTRQDTSSETESMHLCGRRIGRGVIQVKIDISFRFGLG
jgi:hypothetical protein